MDVFVDQVTRCLYFWRYVVEGKEEDKVGGSVDLLRHKEPYTAPRLT